MSWDFAAWMSGDRRFLGERALRLTVRAGEGGSQEVSSHGTLGESVLRVPLVVAGRERGELLVDASLPLTAPERAGLDIVTTFLAGVA